MVSTIRPLGSNVVVRLIETPKVSAGGIHLPEIAELPPQEGEIVAIGLGKLLEDGSRKPMVLKAGQRVLFSHWAGQQVRAEGESLFLLDGDDERGDIVGVLS